MTAPIRQSQFERALIDLAGDLADMADAMPSRTSFDPITDIFNTIRNARPVAADAPAGREGV